MKNPLFTTFLFAILMLFSCRDDSKKVEGLNTKVEKLENELTAAKKETDGLKKERQRALHALSTSSIFDDPWDRFINAPEFWETFFDEDPFPPRIPTQCEKDCAKKYDLDRRACVELTTGDDVILCLTQIRKNQTGCNRRCFNPGGDPDVIK